MDARLFRYLFENTSNAIIMTGCTWDKGMQEQIRYVYSCEMSHIYCRSQATQMRYGTSPIDLFVMGSFSIEDIERFIYVVHCNSVDTALVPYTVPLQRFSLMETILEHGITAYHPDVIEFIKDPYSYLQKSSVKRFYFIYGNGKPYESKGEKWYPEYRFEPQEEEILDIIEEMEGARIPVLKAGYIMNNRMLFYFGHFGIDLRMIRHFLYHYTKNKPMKEFDERQIQKMILTFRKEFASFGVDTLAMYCSPVEIAASQTDCVLNIIVIDKDDLCHADIASDEGRCTLKCMLYNDYDVCHCHRTEDAELRTGVILLGNMKLNKHIGQLKKHFGMFFKQTRAITLPNCGNKNHWDSELLVQNVKKNTLFWVCPIQPQTSDQVLREIKSKNARYRIIGLNEKYGCCFNGFLSDKV